MKQQITKEQWEEITYKQRIKFCKIVNCELDILKNMGQIVEFLGDDLSDIIQLGVFFDDDIDGWKVTVMKEGMGFEIEQDELIDALWKAVIFKLK